ncbi:hypothetical protein FEM48_Zijuj05G0175400 [Ziziphus jujuba var. spinosa]|uniref:Uncharacterized protein n=1 Tax=Ziziphus jujuba var. spinosa TaxID=714518 RepID=A0A978VG65_ZIZJJ|nr:hypothetical protein FEM48_Zijuj05G0175400 [Ziziphus jujuba var. spinosa]
MELSFQLLDKSNACVGSLRRGNILVELGNMLLIYLLASTLLSECLPYSPFKDTKINVIERIQHVNKIKVRSTMMSTACGIHILWDGDKIMIEGKPIKVSNSISHIIERTFDDFANGGMQFSWSSRNWTTSIRSRKGKYLPVPTYLKQKTWKKKRTWTTSIKIEDMGEELATKIKLMVAFNSVGVQGRKGNMNRQGPTCLKQRTRKMKKNLPTSIRTGTLKKNSQQKGFLRDSDFEVTLSERVSARTNIFVSEDLEEEELASISETENMEEEE